MKTYLDGKRDNKKGFTLIELLVVIGIIGILSSIVLVSLQTSRKKALDAAVKQELVQARTAIEIYGASRNDIFAVTCPVCNTDGWSNCETSSTYEWYASDPSVAPIIESIRKKASIMKCAINNKKTLWVVAARLPSSPIIALQQIWWCVDYFGVSKQFIGEYPIQQLAGDIYKCK